MSSLFEAYDEEYSTLTRDISKSISHVTSYGTAAGDPEKKRGQLRHIDALLGQAEGLVKQMEIEVRSTLDQATKRDLQTKVATYKKTLVSMRGDYNRVKEAEERDGLFGSDASGGASQEHRDRLLQTSQRLEQQGQRLEGSKRAIMEIEEVALEITSELGRNREKITSVHGKVSEAKDELGRGEQILSRMGKWFRGV